MFSNGISNIKSRGYRVINCCPDDREAAKERMEGLLFGERELPERNGNVIQFKKY